MSKLKVTDKYFLYGWLDAEKGMHNIGKKVSRKDTYISSISSGEWWSRFSDGKMTQYCIIESDDENVISACEWFALDYGINVCGKDAFYNKSNNASRGDQSLITNDMKKSIVDYFDGKLKPVDSGSKTPLHVNLMNKFENGEYPVVDIPVYELEQYGFLQVREEKANQAGIANIIDSWTENPEQVKKQIDPVIVVQQKDGRKLLNGNTRLGAATRCRGWNTLPVVIIDEKEFGSTKKQREQTQLLFGSVANAEDEVYRKTNTDADLIHQMLTWMALEGITASSIVDNKLAKDSVTELLKINFKNSCRTMRKLSGVITKLFNKIERDEAEITIQENLITYSDSELIKYKVRKYEKKGIPAVISTMASLKHFECIGYVRNRALQYPEADKFALVIYFKTKHEWEIERKEKRIDKLKQIIKRFNDNIVVDVLPAFSKNNGLSK